MNHSKYLALLSLLALASCSDQTAERDIAESRTISFSYTSESSPGSRGSNDAMPPQEITLVSEDSSDTTSLKTYVTVSDIASEHCISRGKPIESPGEITGFMAYSFFHPAGDATPQLFFSDETVSSKGANLYATANSYFWPTDGGNLSFFTLVGASDNTVVSPDTDTPGSFKIEYSMPSEATAQNDLLLATTAPLNTPNTPVPLSFRHLCSQVTFVIGNKMQRGTIKSITLSGINSHGVYTSSWSTVDTPKSFTLNVDKATVGNEAAGTPIAAAEYTLMMIPQTLGPDAKLTVVFDDAISGTTHTLEASLANDSWLQGKKTTYHIGITPRYELRLESPVTVQDAYYIIYPVNIRANNIVAGKNWVAKIEATENPHPDLKPSIQLQADANQYVKEGFWTDKKMTNGTTIDQNSTERGSESFTQSGNGNFPVYIFLPENASDAVRKYTLTISLTDDPSNAVTETITQLPPAWNGNTGWEQIENEEEGIFGFNYDATEVYVYKWSEVESSADRRLSEINGIISQYNAERYAKAYRYYQESKLFIPHYRNYVEIDYSVFKDMGENAQSNTDGLVNTRQMFNYGGPAITKNLENAIINIKYRLNSSVPAYRKREKPGEGTWDPADVPYAKEGTQITQQQILAMALKKNRYYLNTSTDGNLSTTSALIKAEDIVWYIPACDQFAGAPDWYNGTAMSTEDFWSSTVDNEESTNNNNAFDGSSTSIPRGTLKKLRAARNR